MYPVGSVFVNDEDEGVVVHNRKLPGDICILWNLPEPLHECLYSYDERCITERLEEGSWRKIK